MLIGLTLWGNVMITDESKFSLQPNDKHSAIVEDFLDIWDLDCMPGMVGLLVDALGHAVRNHSQRFRNYPNRGMTITGLCGG
ncbi:hypothetical protein TNCV_3251651 [Trichonephila clavipes]|nr:hypothetical protein TNCV_3251651 [Trichonephila clavipes]